MARGLFISDAHAAPGGSTIHGLRTFKLRSLRRWVERHLRTIDHERRVSRLASTLFDLTQTTHGLKTEHRRLLRLAALVHDVGRCRGEHNHARRGAEMILQDRALPLTPPERRLLAYLTRYHRGPVPEVGDDGILARGDGRAHALRLLALLRVADALDCRSLPSPTVTFAWRADRLRVDCAVSETVSMPRARRAFVKPKKFKLAEHALGCRVEVNVRTTDAVPARPARERLIGV